MTANSTPLLADLLPTCAQALDTAHELQAAAREGVGRWWRRGRIDAELLEKHQFAAHGFAWLSTYVEAWRRFWTGPSACRRPVGWASWKG